MSKSLVLDQISLAVDGHEILSACSAEFLPGTITLITGENGSGKSSLAYTIAGREKYRGCTGDIRLGGIKLNFLKLNERAQLEVSLLWQEPARFEGISVAQYVGLFKKDSPAKTVSESVRLVNLDPKKYLKRKVDKTLSGGEMKRIQLSAILNNKSQVVILDEPDAGLDQDSLTFLKDCLVRMKREKRIVILISHQPVLYDLADQHLKMKGGRLHHD
jgi:Fe-S cluster assembly ATP-binding protein